MCERCGGGKISIVDVGSFGVNGRPKDVSVDLSGVCKADDFWKEIEEGESLTGDRQVGDSLFWDSPGWAEFRLGD
jgi:hypothetical protein